MTVVDKQLIRVNVIEALASQERIHRKIDDCYSKNKYQAYRLAIKDELYEHPIFKSRSIKHEIYCRRIIGLLCIDEDYYLNLFVKTAWGSLHHYLITEDVYDIPKIKGLVGFHKVGVEESFNLMIIVSEYARRLGRAFTEKHKMQHIEELYEGRFNNYNKTYAREQLKKHKKQCRHVWLKFCEIHGISPKIGTVDDFFDPFYVDENGIYRVDGLPQIMQYEGLDVVFLGDCQLDEADINYIVYTYLKTLPQGTIPNYDIMLEYMAFAIYSLAFAREFNEVKGYYFKHNRETVYGEMESYEETIKILKVESEQSDNEIAQLKEEVARLKKRDESHEKEIKREIAKVQKESKGEINQLKKENDGLAKDALELRRLRSFLFAPISEQAISAEEARNQVNGHHNLLYVVAQDGGVAKINGLKEQVPNMDFYSGVFPENTEVIFIDYKLLSHRVYNEVVGHAKRTGAPYYYIQSSGVNETLKEMAEILMSQNVVPS